MLSSTLIQQALHLIWGRALTSQPSFRATSEALYSALWIFLLRLIFSKRAPPQAAPPRGGDRSSGLPWGAFGAPASGG
eukprot:33477-Pyramimonas_sp.AAC.1